MEERECLVHHLLDMLFDSLRSFVGVLFLVAWRAVEAPEHGGYNDHHHGDVGQHGDDGLGVCAR